MPPLAGSFSGKTRISFVVGDPNQAIYGWNGADPGFLANVPQPLAGRGGGAPR